MMKLTNKIALEIAMIALMNDANAEFHIDGIDAAFSKQEAMEKLEKMMEQLDKKSSVEKKPTQKQMENSELAERLFDELLAHGGKMTVSDMLTQFDCVKGMSNQKVSAIVRKLKDAGRVVKDVEGRKSLFSAVA